MDDMYIHKSTDESVRGLRVLYAKTWGIPPCVVVLAVRPLAPLAPLALPPRPNAKAITHLGLTGHFGVRDLKIGGCCPSVPQGQRQHPMVCPPI